MLEKTIIVMGVSGSGKTTIGKGLAALQHAVFIDADDLHPTKNIEKMHAGIPLTDEDRWGWLQSVCDTARALQDTGATAIIACSALKKKYRDLLRKGIGNILFVYLHGSFEQIQQLLAGRNNHFMPAALLQSQLDILEAPAGDEPDCITIPILPDLEKELELVMEGLHNAPANRYK